MIQCPKCGHEVSTAKFGLTPKQKQLLDYIEAYLTKHDGVSPSFEDMKLAIDAASSSTIHRLVVSLEDRGFIRRVPGRSRAIQLVAA